jgi:hypothetical protein
MLRSLLQAAAVFALLCLGVSTAVLSYDTHRIALDADKTLRDIDSTVKAQSLDLQQDELQLNLVLDEVGKAATEQRAYWQKTSADSDKTVKALRLAVDRASLLLDHTDKQLNGALIPAVITDATDLDGQIKLTGESAQMAFSSVGHVGDALTFQVDQLDLGPAIANLNESSARLANTMAYLQSASGHADGILGAGERTALYYEKKLTTPASFAKRLGMGLLDVGSKAGNIVTGFAK